MAYVCILAHNAKPTPPWVLSQRGRFSLSGSASAVVQKESADIVLRVLRLRFFVSDVAEPSCRRSGDVGYGTMGESQGDGLVQIGSSGPEETRLV